jgi:hypothetical protein
MFDPFTKKLRAEHYNIIWTTRKFGIGSNRSISSTLAKRAIPGKADKIGSTLAGVPTRRTDELLARSCEISDTQPNLRRIIRSRKMVTLVFLTITKTAAAREPEPDRHGFTTIPTNHCVSKQGKVKNLEF